MYSVCHKVITNQPIGNVLQKVISFAYSLLIFFIRVRMSWNIGDNKNLFLKAKSKLGHYQVVLATPKTSPEKVTLTLIEMQHMPDIERLIPKKKYFA